MLELSEESDLALIVAQLRVRLAGVPSKGDAFAVLLWFNPEQVTELTPCDLAALRDEVQDDDIECSYAVLRDPAEGLALVPMRRRHARVGRIELAMRLQQLVTLTKGEFAR